MIEYPPSTAMICPDTYAAAGDARKAMSPARTHTLLRSRRSGTHTATARRAPCGAQLCRWHGEDFTWLWPHPQRLPLDPRGLADTAR